MAVTINDIARKANVSITTVSRFMNDPQKVKPSTREKIKALIEESHYSPNALARGLVKNETHTIGVIIPDINNLFYPSVVRGIEDAIEKENYNIFLCNTDKKIEKELFYFAGLTDKRVDGIIVLGTRSVKPSDNDHIRTYSQKIPIVMINDFIMGSDVYAVLTDEVEGAYKAAKYLLELGHKNILHLSGEETYSTYVNKKLGYSLALDEYKYDLETIHRSESFYEDIENLKQLFKNIDIPTAILGASDQIALVAMNALLSLGYRIPQDVSVVGYANVPITSITYPALTTVNQFPYLTGQKAAQTMIGLIGGKRPEQKKFILQPELVIRDSCANINK